MGRWTRLALPALAGAAATPAAASQGALQVQDVGLLVLAFLILVPLLIAVQVIPAWIESFRSLAKAPEDALSTPGRDAEADG